MDKVDNFAALVKEFRDAIGPRASLAQLQLLVLSLNNPEADQTEVAEKCGLAHSTTSRELRRFDRQGWFRIIRRDQRSQTREATALGKQLLEELETRL